MKQNHTSIKKTLLLISLLIFIVSLTQTAFTYKDHDGIKNIYGVQVFIMGGAVFLGGGLLEWFVWLANPLYLIGLFQFFKSKASSRKFLLAATIIASSFMSWREILATESGRMAPITALNSGYWLWLASMAILTIGAFYYFARVTINATNL